MFLLVCALSLHAGNRLYDDLSALPSQMLPASGFSAGTFLTPPDDTLLKDLHDYGMSASLQQQFVVFNGEAGKDYLPEYYNVNEALPYRYRKLIEDSVYLQVFLISTIGLLAVMPESVSKWDMDELEEKSLQERWREHLKTKPVWDGDDWAINYIGHPVSGAIYYTLARNDGMSIVESAAYSTLMSTFFWEYGYESFAEIPSIQDLIITPLFGSFMGEGMYRLERKLDKNGGKVWGSRILGNVSYFFLNPMGSIANGVSGLLQDYNSDMRVTMTLQTYPRADDISQFRLTNPVDSPQRFQDRDYGFLITLE